MRLTLDKMSLVCHFQVDMLMQVKSGTHDSDKTSTGTSGSNKHSCKVLMLGLSRHQQHL